MKIPAKPPDFQKILRDLAGDDTKFELFLAQSKSEESFQHYEHWEKVRHLKAPDGLKSEEWWTALKFARRAILKPVALQDKGGRPFQFCVPDLVQEELHRIDVRAGG